MNEDLQRLFIGACHQSISRMSKRAIAQSRRELKWKGKAETPFRDWFFNFFAKNRPPVFSEYGDRFIAHLDENWEEIRNLVELAFTTELYSYVQIKNTSHPN